MSIYFDHLLLGLLLTLISQSDASISLLGRRRFLLLATSVMKIVGLLYILSVSCFVYYILLVMVALCNRADHYIFMLWFVRLLLLSFFPRLISAVGDWMSTILLHMVWS